MYITGFEARLPPLVKRTGCERQATAGSLRSKQHDVVSVVGKSHLRHHFFIRKLLK